MDNILIHILPSILISFFSQYLFHEAGHMAFGKATGWHFICLQVFNLAAVKIKNSFRIMFIRTCSFQCIMYPDSVNSGAALYSAGGCIMNLITALAGFTVMIVGRPGRVIWLYAWCFFVSGVAFFLVNSIPNTTRVCNDMACLMLLKDDHLTRMCHNSQLLAAKQLSEGRTYGQIGGEILCLAPDIAFNDILAYQAVLEFYYYLEIQDYGSAWESIYKIGDKTPVSRCVMDTVYLERLYLEMLLRMQSGDIGPLDMEGYQYDKGSKQYYIKKHEKAGDVHSMRVKAVYVAYVLMSDGRKEQALESLSHAVRSIEGIGCLYSGEVLFCTSQLKKFCKMI